MDPEYTLAIFYCTFCGGKHTQFQTLFDDEFYLVHQWNDGQYWSSWSKCIENWSWCVARVVHQSH